MNATRLWVTVSIILIVGTLISAILATVILDTLLERPVPASVTTLLPREGPRLLPVLGLVANSVLIGLFFHLEFYAVGFDQDTWAPR